LYFKTRIRQKHPHHAHLSPTSTGEEEGEGDKANKDLQYHFIVSSALDIVEERVQIGSHLPKMNPALGGAGGGGSGFGDIMGTGTVGATRELYLGALTAQEKLKVYGYMTNTKIKFIIIVEETNAPLRENDIRMMFRKLHGGFCDLMGNPFYLPGTQINSK